MVIVFLVWGHSSPHHLMKCDCKSWLFSPDCCFLWVSKTRTETGSVPFVYLKLQCGAFSRVPYRVEHKTRHRRRTLQMEINRYKGKKSGTTNTSSSEGHICLWWKQPWEGLVLPLIPFFSTAFTNWTTQSPYFVSRLSSLLERELTWQGFSVWSLPCAHT